MTFQKEEITFEWGLDLKQCFFFQIHLSIFHFARVQIKKAKNCANEVEFETKQCFTSNKSFSNYRKKL